MSIAYFLYLKLFKLILLAFIIASFYQIIYLFKKFITENKKRFPEEFLI